MDFSIQNPVLLINKPSGPTSHDVVDKVRKITGVRRVGHAGTLDPFASGLLIILVGREATKRQAEFLGMDKTYEATIRLGATSTTEDPTGEITLRKRGQSPFFTFPPAETENGAENGDCPRFPLDPGFRRDDIENILSSFVGTNDQLPSSFSAKKIKGKKAYELARRGIRPDLKPKCVTIHSIDILSYEWPILTIHVRASSGTYIRALARDIGEKLGCGAYVEKLKRTAIGPYALEQAQTLPETI